MGLLTKEEYNNYCLRFKAVWDYLFKTSYDTEDVISMICELRKYSLDSNMPKMLKEIGFVYINPEVFNPEKLRKFDVGDLGLFTKEGNFLLLNRFIFPVKDMLGNIIALIGWFPDEKKYITTPSRLFSKQCLFFGMEQFSKTGVGGKYFLVEGIFDSISVRSLGFNCVALMGISISKYTEVLYSLFNTIVAIPDNDSEGRKVVMEDKWKLPNNCKYLRWRGKVKDIDDMIRYYDMTDTLNDALAEDERIIMIDC